MISLLGFLFMTSILGAAFFLGNHQTEKIQKKSPSIGIKLHKNENESAPRKINVKSTKKSISTQVMEEYPEEEEKVGFGLEDLIRKTRSHESKNLPSTSGMTAGHRKPELVMIIDDVSNRRQLKRVQSLPYHITPSIFPPSKMNVHSNFLARGLKHYMIHLPMQSSSPKMNRFTKTMMVNESREQIAHRIREIRKLFPTAKFVNNHTGSVFTSNYPAMRKAYIELKRNGFVFLDSRTTGRSVVHKITRIYKDPYLSRDVFIDNVQNRKAILAQLNRAVRLAKKRGYAIVIGHPHAATFDALMHAQPILSQIRTVYVDDFYREHYGNP